MTAQPAWNADQPGHGDTPMDEAQVTSLYQELLASWNRRDAHAMAALFRSDGTIAGFDGSPIDGRTEIEAHVREIFNSHMTAAYVGKVREVRLLGDGVALLRAVAGMVPPGRGDLNPDLNAIQSLVAVRRNAEWRVALYHNTPAAFHGRPETSRALTEELRAELQKTGT